jgi:hypothetical protein
MASKAISPHILSVAHTAQLLLSILSSRAIASGFLAAAAELLMQAMQLLAAPLAAASASQQQQQQQQGMDQSRNQTSTQPQRKAGRTGLPAYGKQQQLGGKAFGDKGSSKGSQQKKTKLPAQQEKLFTRQAMQQGSSQQQGSQGLGAASEEQQQGLLDDLLCLFEAVVLHLLPAAVRGWEALQLSDTSVTVMSLGGATAAAAGGVMWSSAPAVQEQQQAAVLMFQAVTAVLQTMLDAGAHQDWMLGG